ncbi:hypothetical protein D3C76_1475660 [compost metagenome]
MVNQVITDVMSTWIVAGIFGSDPCHIQSVLCDLNLVVRTVASQPLDHMTIVVSGIEMH